MTYTMRDRPDGMVEIVVSKPTVVGIFPDSEVASKVWAFLSAEEPELPEEQPAGFATAKADVDEMLSTVGDLVEEVNPRRKPRTSRALAVVEEKPRMAAQVAASAAERLSDSDREIAFGRIMGGEKIADVAVDYGLNFYQMRGMWANHKRHMQARIAEAGQQTCIHCKRAFTPSISNPETCARCSK